MDPVNRTHIREITPYTRFKKTAQDILQEINDCMFILKAKNAINNRNILYSITNYEINQFCLLLDKIYVSQTRGEATHSRMQQKDLYIGDPDELLSLINKPSSEHLVLVCPPVIIARFFGIDDFTKIKFNKKRKEHFVEIYI